MDFVLGNRLKSRSRASTVVDVLPSHPARHPGPVSSSSPILVSTVPTATSPRLCDTEESVLSELSYPSQTISSATELRCLVPPTSLMFAWHLGPSLSPKHNGIHLWMKWGGGFNSHGSAVSPSLMSSASEVYIDVNGQTVQGAIPGKIISLRPSAYLKYICDRAGWPR